MRTPLAKMVTGAPAAKGLYPEAVGSASLVWMLSGGEVMRVVSTRSTAPASRCSARRPQALSGAPMAVMLPWLMYSTPASPVLKAMLLVMWSLNERGKFTTTSW